MFNMNKTPSIVSRSLKDDEIVEALPEACSDEKAAVEFLEEQRWGDHPACQFCGSLDVYKMRDRKTGERQKNFRWRCNDCKEQYTVRKGSVMEDSAIPLRHWCYAFWRASTSKKGVSAMEIRRQTRLSYKSALFLMHRIRHAMAEIAPDQLGGAGKIVEADEAYWGTEEGKIRGGKRGGAAHPAMNKVVSLVERGTGRVRSTHVPSVTGESLKAHLERHIDPDTHVMTDASPRYNLMKRDHGFARYDQVNHSRGEYVRDGYITTNHVENYFSILKGGLHGIYHHVSTRHFHRYLSEFDFRYTNRELSDGQRTVLAIQKSQGKRLQYKQPKASRPEECN